ncbi:MAG: 4'-phosphopantetheinyl transferase superfamily protein [Bacteroidaceae bacterium]|nr:4'-phosphopantetheinyl transferase superfamily protein [Bacteroidaceae bacterium]
MPLVEYHTTDDVIFGVWKITETEEELISNFRDCSVDTKTLDTLKGTKRRLQWIASRLMVHKFCGNSVRVVNLPDGKPRLQGCKGNISISHTDGYAVVLISYLREIGVDIELRSRNALRSSVRFMNVAEMPSLQCDNASLVALLHWSVKESLFKVVGNIGGTFKDDIIVSPFTLSEQGDLTLHLHSRKTSSCLEYKGYYILNKDYLVTFCTQTE